MGLEYIKNTLDSLDNIAKLLPVNDKKVFYHCVKTIFNRGIVCGMKKMLRPDTESKDINKYLEDKLRQYSFYLVMLKQHKQHKQQ